MSVSVAAVMREVNNYFETGYRATNYTITGGTLSPGNFVPGTYIAITGSILHDGVHQLDEFGAIPDSTTDEEFYGRVWYLNPPADFIALCEQINKFDEEAPPSGYQSESFNGVYSRSRASGRNGGTMMWQEAFRDALRPYRKMYSEVC